MRQIISKDRGLPRIRARQDRIDDRLNRKSELRRARTTSPSEKEFHHLTLKYIRNAPLDHRKGLGQYFTPRTVRERLFDLLPKAQYRKILDPACGTGEFLLTAHERFPHAEVAGWEIDPNLILIAKRISSRTKVCHRDALEIAGAGFGTYDLVVGNPPYFELTPPPEVRQRFQRVISGRANIFSFFIDIGLSLLREGGILAYVVPQSMNNGAYFQELRRFILSQGGLVALQPFGKQDLFADAQQTVMLLVVQKGRKSNRYVFQRNGILIFSPNPKRLEKDFEGKVTLGELGFTVRTGRIVWNQYKEKLTRNPREGVPLLWANNIGQEGLVFPLDHPQRPQYVRASEPDEGPAIVVNRITGASSHAKLRAAIVPRKMRFFGENHVNVIFPPGAKKQMAFDFHPKHSPDLATIVQAMRSREALQAIQLITGNTQFSSTELTHLLPLAL